uniref:Uncharacterized protein n=1 Tax=Anguilla anguilla TaxID=7936 RepID=A0A0E9XFB3_ANGAN
MRAYDAIQMVNETSRVGSQVRGVTAPR